MAPRKKNDSQSKRGPVNPNAVIENAGVMVEQPITETLEKNYMPYAMSVILSRAIPEIDGFKPSHRKLLYTMYKMGLLTSARTKSANVVGQTMRLNPHGDAAIYETLVRLSRGYEALLYPYVDSKGNFGKAYSRDMAYAASRYTEVKLEKICQELFSDIDKDTVDFVDNYDATMKEPKLLPVTYPGILVNANMGIAVGMASSICPFNLGEVCETTIALMNDPNHDISSTLTAPDFPGGGYILYNKAEMDKIYSTGRGSVTVRSRYTYDKQNNCIDITEIPPTTTIEAIMDKVIDLIKAGRIREIADMRDETDRSGLKITIDLKRGTDPDKLMQKLFRLTPLEDNFSCNFNVLVGGMPEAVQTFVATNDTQAMRARQRSILDTYRADITRYVRDKEHARRIKTIYDAIPAQLNKENQRFIVSGIDKKQRYDAMASDFDWLKDAGVALPVNRVTEAVFPLGMSLEKSFFKLYMNDVGLLFSTFPAADVREILLNAKRINFGHAFENAVAQELRAHGHENLFYYHTPKIGEVDFLVEQPLSVEVLPVEVKSGSYSHKHAALDRLMEIANYDIPVSFVLHRFNVETEPRVFYLPIYMAAFL